MNQQVDLKKGFRITGKWMLKNLMGALTYLCSPIALILRVAKVRVLNLNHYAAIGHLSLEPYIYILEKKLGRIENFHTILFPPIASPFDKPPFKLKVANVYLLDVLREFFWIPTNLFLHVLLYPILKSPLLAYNVDHYFSLLDSSKTFFSILKEAVESNQGKIPAVLKIDHAHNVAGKAILGKFGLPKDAWYVCFHCREPGYNSEQETAISSFRNGNINSLELGLQEVLNRGGWCIRMGSQNTLPLKGALKEMGRIIDYPHTEHYSDFMDIFLIANCRFFIGGASGLSKKYR